MTMVLNCCYNLGVYVAQSLWFVKLLVLQYINLLIIFLEKDLEFHTNVFRRDVSDFALQS